MHDSADKCASCRHAVNITGRCSFHDLPLADAARLSCKDLVADLGTGTGRPRTKPFARKKSTHIETFLYGFLTTCGGILFVMAIFLFFFSDDERWQEGIWGVIGFVFLGGLGALCFYGSLRQLKDAYAERKKAADKEP
ncbi:MAG: hypothetical protein FWD88_08010 [Treponema sp.]|nr:hypothetical protein [Treponema sp.]